MTLKLAQFCDDPKKISTKSSYPQKILRFSENPKKYWNSELWSQKNSPEPTYVWKYQSTHPGVQTTCEFHDLNMDFQPFDNGLEQLGT